MDTQVSEDICTSCGGTGLKQHWHGPFYAEVPAQHRATFRDHLQSRHEVLTAIDRSLAKRLLALRKQRSSLQDDIEHIRVLADAAEQTLAEDTDASIQALFTLACRAVWILETQHYSEPDTPDAPA